MFNAIMRVVVLMLLVLNLQLSISARDNSFVRTDYEHNVKDVRLWILTIGVHLFLIIASIFGLESLVAAASTVSSLLLIYHVLRLFAK